MQPLAAGGLDEALQAQRIEPVAHLARRGDHRAPGHVLAGIEIEDQPVRLARAGRRVEPQGWISTTLACTRLSSPSRSSIASIGSSFAHVDPPHLLGEARPGMLGEEALGAGAARAAHQAQHAAGHVRQNPVGDVGVEVREALFGDAGLLPQHALGMGERSRPARQRAPSIAALSRFRGISSTTSVAGLSSRNPLNEELRISPSRVQPRYSTSQTSRGSTQTTPFSAPAGGGFARAGFVPLILSSSLRSDFASASDQPVPTRPA